jgi:hypothetical protein
MEDRDEFPHSRVIADDGEWAASVEKVDESLDGAAVAADPDRDVSVVQRVWDVRNDVTVETTSYPMPPGTDELHVQNAALEREDSFSMIYVSHESGDLRYAFDLAAPEDLRSYIESEREAERTGHDEEDHYERSFELDGIDLRWQFDGGDEPDVSLTVPYSLYARSRRRDGGSLTAMLPESSDNDYDRYTHGALLESLRTAAEEYVSRIEGDLTTYRRVAFVSEFVQTIPHATDWESTGEFNYVRTPEESLVEMTADCKDGSTLLYNLFESMGLDPVFLFLAENVYSGSKSDPDETKDKALDSKTDDGKEGTLLDLEFDAYELYPNHLAVGLPMREIEPVPDDVDGDVATIETGNETYAYVESTVSRDPAVFPSERSDARVLVYTSRSDFATNVLGSLIAPW